MNGLRAIAPALLLLLISQASVAQQNSSPREQLNQYVADLRKNPSDDALREKIIKLTLELKPPPAIPEEARRHFVIATTLQTKATNLAGYELAIDEYRQALLLAPWWGDAYHDEAVALEVDKKYEEATSALKLYLLTKPAETDARQAQDKIYSLEAGKKLVATERAQQTRDDQQVAEKAAANQARAREAHDARLGVISASASHDKWSLVDLSLEGPDKHWYFIAFCDALPLEVGKVYNGHVSHGDITIPGVDFADRCKSPAQGFHCGGNDGVYRHVVADKDGMAHCEPGEYDPMPWKDATSNH